MTHKVTDETRSMVENAAGMGLSHEDIACLLGVRDPKTIRRRYRKELNSGRAKANLQVASKLFKKATEGDNTAMIWWEKTRAGKSDRLALVNPPGEVFKTANMPAQPELIGEYLARLEAIAADRAAGGLAERVAKATLQDDGGDPDPLPD